MVLLLVFGCNDTFAGEISVLQNLTSGAFEVAPTDEILLEMDGANQLI